MKPFQHLAKNLLEFQSMYIDGCNPELLEGSVFTFMEDWLRKQLQHTGEDLAAQYVEQIEEWQHPSTTKKQHSRPWNWRSYCMVDNHWLDISRAPGGLKTTTRTPWLELGLARIGLSYV